MSQLGLRHSRPSGVSPVVGQSPFPVVGPRVRFSDAAPDSWKQSDAVSDSLNTGGVVSDLVKPSVSQDTLRHSDAVECRPSMLNYRPKKGAKYDGKTSWADYLVQFDKASQLNGWNNSQKAMELATSLEGTARSVLADLRPEHQLDFKSLIDKLTQRFEPEGQAGIYHSCKTGNKNETKASQSWCRTSVAWHVRDILQLMSRREAIWLSQASSVPWVTSHRNCSYIRRNLKILMRQAGPLSVMRPSRQQVVKRLPM